MRGLFVGFFVLLVLQLSHQQCNVQPNTNYNTAGDLVTLYNVPSTQDCCAGCQTFEECSKFSYNIGSKQCVIKSSSAALVQGTATNIDSGTFTNSYSRPTACGQQDANTDYYLQSNLGSAASSSPADCCAKCSAVVGCNYWTLASGTCWFKSNLGQKKSSAGITSGTVIPTSVLNTPTRTGKKGLALFGTLSCSDIKKLTGISWVYNWKETPDILEECFNELGIQYVPMVWGRTAQFDVVYGNSPYLLTFNEPNFPDQSNLSPQDAAGLWPQVQAVAAKYGMLISSPSASYGGANMDPIQWLDQFFAACVGCKVDFITTHQYDCNFVNLHGAITNFYKYGKPVWVTEFSCWSTTAAQSTTFVNGILPLFDNDANIQRYSYFGSRSAGGAFMDVFDSTKSALTSVGVAYNGGAAPTSPPSTPAPTSPPTSPPSTPAPTPKPTSPPTSPPSTPAPTPKPTSPPSTPAPTSPPSTPAPTSPPSTPAPTSPPSTPAPTPVPTSSPSSLPANGYLQSKSNGLYVALDSSNNLAAIASTATAIYFKFAPITGGYTLQNGIYFVSAENGGGSPLDANRYTAGGWETFVFTQQSGGYWAIQAVNSLYVTVTPAQGNELIATSATPATDAALFRVAVPVPPTTSVNPTTSPKIRLFSAGAGAWVGLDAYNNWAASAGDPAAAVTWNVGGSYTLQNAATGQYSSAENGGTAAVVANRPTASGWETFSFVQQGNTYAILATANGKLVSLQSTGYFIPTVTNSGTIPASALFYIVSA